MPDVITLDEIQEYFDRISEDWNTQRWDTFLQSEQAIIAQIHTFYFETESGPDGAPWPPLSPNTRKRIGIEGPDKILVDTGDLRTSLTEPGEADNAIRWIDQNSEETFLLFGTMLPYSSAHDEEDPFTGRPARIHLGLTEEYCDMAAARAADYAVAGLVDV